MSADATMNGSLSPLLPAELRALSARVRGQCVLMSHKARTPHLGSCLSCVDLLSCLYGAVLNVSPETAASAERDRFVLSKGHAAVALYSMLAARGFFPWDRLLTEYNVNGGLLPEHPGPGCMPGVEAATGSLGHGLPIATGMAMAARIQSHNYRVYAVLSDGECNEGSTWEAAMYAAGQKLDRLTILVDYNKWQATDRSNEVMALASLRDKWAAFGWDACEVDGHDIDAILEAIRRPVVAGRPRAIVAHTVKGRGVSFMEDDNNWHYRIPTEVEVQQAHAELGLV